LSAGGTGRLAIVFRPQQQPFGAHEDRYLRGEEVVVAE